MQSVQALALIGNPLIPYAKVSRDRRLLRLHYEVLSLSLNDRDAVAGSFSKKGSTCHQIRRLR